MAGILDTIKSTIGIPGKRVYDTEKRAPQWSGMSLKEKLQALVMEKRLHGREARQRRHTTYYLMALYYQGYQNVELSTSNNRFDIYERDDFYVENQFRRHVDVVVQMLNRMEGDVVVRPASSSPTDLATARVAEPILEGQLDEIAYDTVLDRKNLIKCLMGNAFTFTDYVTGAKYGSIVTPKFSYEDKPDEMGQMMPSKVVSGFQTKHKGKQVATVCSPLEINISPDVMPFTEAPFIQWISRQDIDLLNYLYPGLNIDTGGSPTETDLAQQYLDILSNLSGNILGESLAWNRGVNQGRKAELVRTWLAPCTFRGDKELENEFQDGAHVTTINGKVVEYYEEAMTDRWTHEVLIPVPHSLLGDGLYDAILMQDQINEVNSLLIQHLRYTSCGKRGYDANAVDTKDVFNDPSNAWIPFKPAIDKSVRDVVVDLSPIALSQDVPAWLAAVKGSMQDMTSAYDPASGKSIGANTPYSQSVFLNERAQSRWQGSLSFNRPEMIRFRRQLLEDAKRHDDLKVATMNNIGQWSFEQFTAADLQGTVDILMSNTDMNPKTRAEQVQGLQMLTSLAPIIPGMPPKQKLRVEEMLGLPPDSNPMSGQISRAYRIIDRIRKGETITPLPLVDVPQAQIPVYADWLASEEGEAVAQADPEIFANIYTYMMTLMQMGVMQSGSPGGQAAHQIQHGSPAQGQQGGQGSPPAQKGQPGGQPGQQGGGPNPGGQAQSPAAAPPIPPSEANNNG